MNSEQLILKYFNSWQVPTDLEEMISCLDENLSIDGGFFKFDNSADLIKFIEANPSPWKEVKLLSSIFSKNKGAICYEGINTENNVKMRVSEHISISKGKIVEILTVITQLNN